MPAHYTKLIFPPMITSASVGREWSTAVTEMLGAEQRNARWTASRWRINLGGGKILPSELEMWDAFIDAVKGRHNTFLFRLNSSRFEITDQIIGDGDGSETEFQIIRTRSYQGQSSTETIRYPVHNNYPQQTPSGTTMLDTEYITVKLDDVEQTLTTDYTVDRETGIITFTTAPTSGAEIKVSCKYFVLVRFNQDWNPLDSAGGKSYDIPSGVELIEPKGGE